MMLAVLLLAMATKGESKVLMLSWDRTAKVVKHYTEGSGTPRQAWLNYHDERNMNHKQTEM